jgi:hypothetical protein
MGVKGSRRRRFETRPEKRTTATGIDPELTSTEAGWLMRIEACKDGLILYGAKPGDEFALATLRRLGLIKVDDRFTDGARSLTPTRLGRSTLALWKEAHMPAGELEPLWP